VLRWVGRRWSRKTTPPTTWTPADNEVAALQGWRRLGAAELAAAAVATSDAPRVSVIIPTYGQVAYTLRCLASIAANPPAARFEIIVIDDGSPEPDAAEPGTIPWVRFLRADRNLGFIGACNAAAREARGHYLCFLNNDTAVAPDRLDSLIEVADRDAAVGLVGSRLVYPDGRLQEAGAVIYRDGVGWNCGRLQDPRVGAYNFLRETDYCSGASLLIARALFEKLVGFDSHYAPAYFEDADLAFRVRPAGLKVVYQPRSLVLHHDDVSNGQDPVTGVKRHQAINRLKFVARWRPVLEAEHSPPGVVSLRHRDRAGARPMLLIIDHYVPEPDRDAGSKHMRQMIELLAEAGFLVKLWPQQQRADPVYVAPLQRLGVEVLDGERSPFERWLRTHRADLDAVLVSRPHVAQAVLKPLQASRLPLLYLGHDIHFERMSAQAKLTGDAALARAARETRALERRIWRAADRVLYFSPEEAATVAALEPRAKVRVLTPYGFDAIARDGAAPAGQDILFVAGFAHPPNVDAAEWLARDILPRILAVAPSARLRLVGSAPTDRVLALGNAQVTVTGHVNEAELAAEYAAARLAIVPLRFGAGVKLKVVEALRHGLPLVTTSVGAQGLPGLSEVASLTDDPAEIAAAAIRLLRDDALWANRSAAQRAYAESRFSRAAMKASLLEALEPAIAAAAGRRRR
jgi:GT2 family glycosyltransferase/glycosyltransferase involved in cell wall biosynthesis